MRLACTLVDEVRAQSLGKRHGDSRTGQRETESDNGNEYEPVLVKNQLVVAFAVGVHAALTRPSLIGSIAPIMRARSTGV
jgi:hypothetical protein